MVYVGFALQAGCADVATNPVPIEMVRPPAMLKVGLGLTKLSTPWHAWMRFKGCSVQDKALSMPGQAGMNVCCV